MLKSSLIVVFNKQPWLHEGNTSFSNLESIYSLMFNGEVFINKLKEELYKSYENDDSLVLFHGAKSEIVGAPSIEYSGSNKDFGKGFYLGTSIDQPSSFVSTFKESSVYIYKFSNARGVKSRNTPYLKCFYIGKRDKNEYLQP